MPRACEQQFEVVVDFGRRAHGRTGVARVDLLLDGDGRRDARDDVHVGFVDLPEELPGVGREALDVAALPLGETRVEGQRRFARTGKSRHDDEFVVRNFDLDVAEVVDPRSFYINAVFVFHVSCLTTYPGVTYRSVVVAAFGVVYKPDPTPNPSLGRGLSRRIRNADAFRPKIIFNSSFFISVFGDAASGFPEFPDECFRAAFA